MNNNKVTLTRDCTAHLIPVGTPVTLKEGTEVKITQDLGGAYTVEVQGNLVRIPREEADALGVDTAMPNLPNDFALASDAPVEDQVWSVLKNCFDPEIPVNIVDLGLIYEVTVKEEEVTVQMTLTAPGCGMGDVIAQDVQNKVQALPLVEYCKIDLVFDPPWDQSRMSDETKLKLGLL